MISNSSMQVATNSLLKHHRVPFDFACWLASLEHLNLQPAQMACRNLSSNFEYFHWQSNCFQTSFFTFSIDYSISIRELLLAIEQLTLHQYLLSEQSICFKLIFKKRLIPCFVKDYWRSEEQMLVSLDIINFHLHQMQLFHNFLPFPKMLHELEIYPISIFCNCTPPCEFYLAFH